MDNQKDLKPNLTRLIKKPLLLPKDDTESKGAMPLWMKQSLKRKEKKEKTRRKIAKHSRKINRRKK